MKNIINRYIEKIKKEHTFRRRAISVLLCLGLVVSAGVFWNLRLTGISMTSDVACQIEEHVHNEACNDNVLVCAIEESDEHTHEETCYEAQLICEKEEHAHTVSCLSDETADVEIASDWEESLPTVLNGNWAENVLTVAKSQLGYTESEKNFILDEVDNTRKGYTRYGQWYGNLYADWNTMFMAFCLNYGEVPKEAVPRTSGCFGWVTMLTEAGLYKEATDYIAEAGDIVFFDTDENSEADKVGIVSEVTETEIITVEGDYENSVAYVTYNKENNEDAGIVGVLDLNDAYLAYSEANAEELAKADESESEVEVTEEPVESVACEVATAIPSETVFTEDLVKEAESSENSFTEAENSVENKISDDNDSVLNNEDKIVFDKEENITSRDSNEAIFDNFLTHLSIVEYFSDANTASTIASGTTSSGLTWALDDTGLLTISGTGAMSSSDSNSWSSYRTSIKKVVISEGVTSIGFTAFSGCTSLAELVIPDSVKSIDACAFQNCTSLTELVIPKGVTNIHAWAFDNFNGASLKRITVSEENPVYLSEEGVLFNKSKTELILYPPNKKETEYKVPDTVVKICEDAFRACSILTNVFLPQNLNYIGSEAFRACTSLVGISIPGGVSEIPLYTFYGCLKLSNVTFNEGLKIIGNSAFYNCSSLTELKMPSTVTRIENYAFDYCAKLESIKLNEGLSYIGAQAFGRSKLTELLIPSTVVEIERSIFYNSKQAINLVYNAVAAEELSSPSGNISTITVNNNVNYLPSDFFLYFSSGVENIEFICPNIIEMECASTTSTDPFMRLSGYIYIDSAGVFWKLDPTTKSASLAYYPGGSAEFTIPEKINVSIGDTLDGEYDVKGVESYAISKADGLTSITFAKPENITSLADYALANCLSLSTVVNGAVNPDDANSKTNNVNQVLSWFNGATIGQDILKNTGLFYGTGDFSIENPINGKESTVVSDQASDGTTPTISIVANPGSNEEYSWVPVSSASDPDNEVGGYYDFLTGETFSFTAGINLNGCAVDKEYRIYIETNDPNMVINYEIGKEYKYVDEKKGYEVPFTYCETDIPGITYFSVGIDLGQSFLFSPVLTFRNMESDGGGIRVWGAIFDPDAAKEGKYVAPTESGTVQAFWRTETNDFKLYKYNDSNSAASLFGDGQGGAGIPTLGYNFQLITSTANVAGYGDDHVKWIDFEDTFELPSYMEWPDSLKEDIKNNNISIIEYSENILINVGEIEIARIGEYAHDNSNDIDKEVSNIKVSLADDRNLVISFRWNNLKLTLDDPENSQEFGFSRPNIYINTSHADVDIANYNSDEKINNSITAHINYTFNSNIPVLSDYAEKEVNEPTASVEFDKSSNGPAGSGNTYSYGNIYDYRISVYNNGALNYTFPDKDIIVTDELDSWHYITPENMERMLDDEFGKYLTISINKATLCSDERHMSEEVKAVDGSVAYITGENSNLDYKECDLTICWENGKKVIKDGSVTHEVIGSLEATLSDLNYILINESTMFSMSWDMSDINDDVLYGGEFRYFYVYSTIKNTFQHGTEDLPERYLTPQKTRNDAYLKYDTEIIKSDYVTSTWSYEANISKSLSVNGINSTSDTSIYYGDILDYSVAFTKNSGKQYINGEYVESFVYNNLPIVDVMEGSQKLLVPVSENTHLMDYKLDVKTIDDIEYYILSKPESEEKIVYKEVSVGTDISGTLLIANDITVENDKTTIKWYYPSISNGTKNISYKAIVDLFAENADNTYYIDNTVYANDRVNNRIYAKIPGYTVNLFDADKEIYDIDNEVSLGKYCAIDEGDTVEYRLTLEALTDKGYTIYGNEIKDVLPETYGSFAWNEVIENGDVNVKVELAPGQTGVSFDKFDEWYIEPGTETGEYVIKWPDEAKITFDSATPLYIYVTITFPKGDVWEDYIEKHNSGQLYNTFYVNEWEFPVSHEIKIPGEVYLQKGVFDVGRTYLSGNYSKYSLLSKGDRNYYSDSVMTDNYVSYYITVCNKGKSRMYLSEIYDELPEGFTLKQTINCGSRSLSYNVPSYSSGYKNYVSYTSSGFTKYSDSEIKFMNAKVTGTVSNGVITFCVSDSTANNSTYLNDDKLKYDSLKDMYYLDKNEAISFAYVCQVNRNNIEEDIAENTVWMEYQDFLNAGVKISDTDVTADTTRTNSEGINDGDCRLINGKILESSVEQTRSEIEPGIQKKPISYIDNLTKKTINYDYYAPHDAIINWRIRLENNGHMPIYNYTVSDTMENPYVFVTGDTISIKVYDDDGMMLGSGDIPFTEAARNVGGTNVTFDMELINHSGYVMTSYKSATAHVEITYNDTTKEETLSLDFNSAYTAIPNLGYVDIEVSTENTSASYANKVYINATTLTPHGQEFSSVTSGIPNVNGEGNYESITTYAPVNIVFDYATASLKAVEELNVPVENKANSNGVPQKYITLADKDNIFKYTLTVMAPENIAMNKLVLIDSLPEIGDHSPYSADVKRGSEFKVSLNLEEDDTIPANFQVTITYDGGEAQVVDPSLYDIEYSNETTFDSTDRNGGVDSSWAENRWYTTPNEATRSFRVILDGTKVSMPIKSTVTVSFDAKVDDINAVPGDIAWNSFGYYYNVDVLGSTYEFEAMPLEVGVQIPSCPTIQKKTVYQEGETAYVHDTDLEFTYLVHKGEPLTDYTNLTNDSFAEIDNQVTVVTLKVPAGSSESVINKRLLEDVNCYSLNTEGEWVEDSTKPFQWIADEKYTIYELPNEDFKLRKLVSQRKNAYTFTYDPSVERTFVCENSPKKWEIDLKKVDSADNTHVLADAKFALYSKDKAELINDTDYANLSDAPEKELNVSGETWYLVKTAITGEEGKIKFENLMSEVYYLYEYKAPDGYYSKTPGQNLYYSDTVTGTNTVTVENIAGTSLPLTGGNGTAKLLALGLALMATSAAMLYLKKRKFKIQ